MEANRKATKDKPNFYNPTAAIRLSKGVVQEPWEEKPRPGDCAERDFYVGTAEALVEAGVVPSLDMFPGQPGRGGSTSTFRPAAATGSSRGAPLVPGHLRIGKLPGGTRFRVGITVSVEEQQRRKLLRKLLDGERGARWRITEREQCGVERPMQEPERRRKSPQRDHLRLVWLAA